VHEDAAHVAALCRIESSLAAAAVAGWTSSDRVQVEVVDINRTFLCRGLILAQAETGDRADYWRPR
jgi:hypothetical protein